MIFVWAFVFLAAVWLCSCLVAWSINRHELKLRYGHAPFNWRIFGYTSLYVPYLEQLQQRYANDETEED